MPFNDPDQRVIVKWTVALEAQDQPLIGKVAVAYVIKNRALAWKKTLAEVCFQKWQFFCWTPENGLAGEITALQNTPVGVMKECGHAVDIAMEGIWPDPTHGATNYLNIELTKQQNNGKLPDWALTMQHVAKIGEHDFYK